MAFLDGIKNKLVGVSFEDQLEAMQTARKSLDNLKAVEKVKMVFKEQNHARMAIAGAIGVASILVGVFAPGMSMAIGVGLGSSILGTMAAYRGSRFFVLNNLIEEQKKKKDQLTEPSGDTIGHPDLRSSLLVRA